MARTQITKLHAHIFQRFYGMFYINIVGNDCYLHIISTGLTCKNNKVTLYHRVKQNLKKDPIFGEFMLSFGKKRL